ncbi:hypothetical protein ACR6C2_16880 [Streptomyces sp. INA 01156]
MRKPKAVIYLETKEELISFSELEALSELKACIEEYGCTLVGALVEPAGDDYSVEFLRILRMWRNEDVQYVLTWDAELNSRAFYDTEFPGFPDLRDVDALLEAPDPTEGPGDRRPRGLRRETPSSDPGWAGPVRQAQRRCGRHLREGRTGRPVGH